MTDRKISEEEAREELETKSQKVGSDDVQKVLSRKEDIEARFEKSGYLNRFINELKLMFSMVQDYWNGDYREVPWMTIAAVVAALLYVLSPVDLIPDFIPGIGLIDDAAVVVACLNLIQSDFEAYKAWKGSNLLN